jgi:hypothetical protein
MGSKGAAAAQGQEDDDDDCSDPAASEAAAGGAGGAAAAAEAAAAAAGAAAADDPSSSSAAVDSSRLRPTSRLPPLTTADDDRLTVILPQSLSRQPQESRELLARVGRVVEMPRNDGLALLDASRICNREIIGSVQQVVCFAFRDSRLLLEVRAFDGLRAGENERWRTCFFFLRSQARGRGACGGGGGGRSPPRSRRAHSFFRRPRATTPHEKNTDVRRGQGREEDRDALLPGLEREREREREGRTHRAGERRQRRRGGEIGRNAKEPPPPSPARI